MDEEVRSLERSARQGDPEAQSRFERARARAGHETTATALEELEALERAERADEQRFTQEGLAHFQRYVEAVFDAEPGLRMALIRGYTPEFCDGDLCEHTQWVVLRGEELEVENDLAPERATAFTRGLGEFEPVLRARHGTDWQLTLRRGDRCVEVDVTPWSCGY